jgi:hypothetical protein
VLTEGTILEQFDSGCIGNIKQFRHEVVITSDSDYEVMRGNFSSMSERSGTTQNGGYFNQINFTAIRS